LYQLTGHPQKRAKSIPAFKYSSTLAESTLCYFKAKEEEQWRTHHRHECEEQYFDEHQ
jgi:hypothetical protein